MTITIKNLTKSFNGNLVLDCLNLEIKKGSSLCIIGGSGSGKSVLIKIIIGLIAQDYGSIHFDDNILNKHTRRSFMQKCGFLFQSGALFDSLNIMENITFYLKEQGKKNLADIAVEKLESVGLDPNILNMYPSELSGGMQKRVALARAICTNPEIIFFDEPTTGLDPVMSNKINNLIIDLKHKLNATTITITHDMNSVYSIATEVAMLYKGKILWNGDVNEMISCPNPVLQQFITGSIDGPIKV